MNSFHWGKDTTRSSSLKRYSRVLRGMWSLRAVSRVFLFVIHALVISPDSVVGTHRFPLFACDLRPRQHEFSRDREIRQLFHVSYSLTHILCRRFCVSFFSTYVLHFRRCHSQSHWRVACSVQFFGNLTERGIATGFCWETFRGGRWSITLKGFLIVL
jgi:hypothetical protein